MAKLLTVAIVHKDGKVLLGMKKKGFGRGHWNGFGGKVEPNETIESATKRELLEEAGLTALTMIPMGVIDFSFDADPKVLQVHFFRVDKYSGEPRESEEMRPQWFDIDNIPYEQMWPDDKHWLPLLLKGQKFRGKFHFDRPSDENYTAVIKKMELEEIAA
jgi:8-oxo-dGTP diphosphatase/2-hydroxy-dATP diphosphatase